MLFPLKFIILSVLFGFFALFIQAETQKSFVSQEQKKKVQSMIEQAKQKIEPYKDEVSRSATAAKAIVQHVIEHEKKNLNASPCLSKLGAEKNGCQVIKPGSVDLSQKTSSVHTSTKVIVFISFSMPEESLKALFNEAENNSHVRLVLRGFIDDSMERTAQRIHDLKGVVDVDPEIFEQYHIEQVPTFMWTKNDQALGKISGNVTLAYANEIFNEKIEKEEGIA